MWKNETMRNEVKTFSKSRLKSMLNLIGRNNFRKRQKDGNRSSRKNRKTIKMNNYDGVAIGAQREKRDK